MAIVNVLAHVGAAYSFTTPSWWSETDTAVDGNSRELLIASPASAMLFTGSFAYDGNGRPSGTATALSIANEQALVAEISGIRLSMSTAATHLENPQGGPAFMAYLLGGSDTITSASGRDTIAGYAGNDLIVLKAVGGSADGGSGTDTLSFSTLSGHGVNASLMSGTAVDLAPSGTTMRLAGFEHLLGSGNNDVLEGTAGANRIDGRGGSLDLVSYAHVAGRVSVNLVSGHAVGAGGSDTLVSIEGAIGSAYDDRLNGTDAANWLEGGAGSDTLTGGLGNDTYVADADDLLVEVADGGIDTIRSATDWTLSGPFECLVLTGTAALHGTGSAVANRIEGNLGNNVLDGGAGVDTLVGGAGSDTYLINDADVVIERSEDTGTDTVRTTVSYSLTANVEHLVLLGSADLRGTGNSQPNMLYGNSGDNVLDGRAGSDVMRGGRGDDTYIVDNAFDQCIEVAGGGIDTVRTSVDFGKLPEQIEHAVLIGSTATVLQGNDLDNRLTGNANDNQINGGLGADTMAGGAGDDTYRVQQVGDQVVEAAGAGVDTVITTVDHTLSENVEHLRCEGWGSFNLVGNSLANSISAWGGNDTLTGGAGADTLSGGHGSDVYIADARDTIIETGDVGFTDDIDEVRIAANWTIISHIENATLLGAGHFSLTGNSADNLLTGNVGNNLLDGAGGADTVVGGVGADRFVVSGSQLLAADLFSDFGNGADRLEVRQDSLAIGDGDAVIDRATTLSAPGGYAAATELLIVDTALAGDFSATAVAAAMGRAASGFSAGQTMLVTVNNHSDSALYLFRSTGTDANVSAAELTCLAVLSGHSAVRLDEVVFAGP